MAYGSDLDSCFWVFSMLCALGGCPRSLPHTTAFKGLSSKAAELLLMGSSGPQSIPCQTDLGTERRGSQVWGGAALDLCFWVPGTLGALGAVQGLPPAAL